MPSEIVTATLPIAVKTKLPDPVGRETDDVAILLLVKKIGDDHNVIRRSAQALLAAHHYTGNIREHRSILLRSLFFRKGRNVSDDDIRTILASLDPPQPQSSRGNLTNDVAREIYASIVDGHSDFWFGIYEPYSANRIIRVIVIEIIELARAAGADTMP